LEETFGVFGDQDSLTNKLLHPEKNGVYKLINRSHHYVQFLTYFDSKEIGDPCKEFEQKRKNIKGLSRLNSEYLNIKKFELKELIEAIDKAPSSNLVTLGGNFLRVSCARSFLIQLTNLEYLEKRGKVFGEAEGYSDW